MLSQHIAPNIFIAPQLASHEVARAAPQRTFRHHIDIYLKDSNAYANTYFSRYFEWQGVCRERWFHQCVRADMLQQEGVFITKRAHQEYQHLFTEVRRIRLHEVIRALDFILWDNSTRQIVSIAEHEQRLNERAPA